MELIQDTSLAKKGDMVKHLSIIICTFNRSDILMECLASIQSLAEKCEIIIVNNYVNDNIENIRVVYPWIKLVVEPNIGLSHARNRGVKESTNDWLFFLDDDAKLVDGSLTQVLDMINSNRFDLVTGIWKAWFKSPPPKWLPHSTGNYILKGTDEIRDVGEDFVSGGVMLINKQKLKEIGGFPTHLGMTGDKVAYGEETYVEEEFKKRGWKVGINPNIVIDHLVGEHKYKLSWHLKSARARGASSVHIFDNKSLLKRVLLLGFTTFRAFIKGIIKLISSKDYYGQNFIIAVLSPMMYFIGTCSSNLDKPSS